MYFYLDFEAASKATLSAKSNSDAFTDTRGYCRHPSTRLLCMAFAIADGEVQIVTPEDATEFRLPDGDLTFVCHNKDFDFTFWHLHMVPNYGWPEIPIERWQCTAAISAYFGLPRNLDESGRCLRIANPKTTSFKTMLSKMSNLNNKVAEGYLQDPDKLNALYTYCRQDVAACRDIHEYLGPLPTNERKVFRLDHLINERGIGVDVGTILNCEDAVTQLLLEANQELNTITYGQVKTATNAKAIGEFCGLPNCQKETVAEALASDNLNDTTRRVLEIRELAGASSLKKYGAMARTRHEGRIQGLLKYYGAHTGRWAGAGVQPQNLPRPKIKLNEQETDDAIHLLNMHNLAEVDAIYHPGDLMSTLVRSMFMAGPGMKFFIADFSQIEARALAWLAGQKNIVRAFRNGDPIYEEVAAYLYSVPIEKVTSEMRQVGKVATLGCGYGLGATKFREQLSLFGVEQTQEFCVNVVQGWRRLNNAIVRFWRKLEHDAIQAWHTQGTSGDFSTRNEFLVYKLPNTRELFYLNPMVSTGEYGPEISASLPQHKTVVRRKLYGGLLAENITQAVCRDVMVDAMFRLEENGYPIVLTVHDEIICETDENDNTIEEMLELMVEPPKWAGGLPIAADGFVSKRYRK